MLKIESTKLILFIALNALSTRVQANSDDSNDYDLKGLDRIETISRTDRSQLDRIRRLSRGENATAHKMPDVLSFTESADRINMNAKVVDELQIRTLIIDAIESSLTDVMSENLRLEVEHEIRQPFSNKNDILAVQKAHQELFDNPELLEKLISLTKVGYKHYRKRMGTVDFVVGIGAKEYGEVEKEIGRAFEKLESLRDLFEALKQFKDLPESSSFIRFKKLYEVLSADKKFEFYRRFSNKIDKPYQFTKRIHRMLGVSLAINKRIYDNDSFYLTNKELQDLQEDLLVVSEAIQTVHSHHSLDEVFLNQDSETKESGIVQELDKAASYLNDQTHRKLFSLDRHEDMSTFKNRINKFASAIKDNLGAASSLIGMDLLRFYEAYTPEVKVPARSLVSTGVLISGTKMAKGWQDAGLKLAFPSLSQNRHHVENSVNPALLELMPLSDVVSNSSDETREENIFVIGGPNAGGKSNAMRLRGQETVFGQRGLPLPQRKSGNAKIKVHDTVIASFAVKDNPKEGKSKYMVELDGLKQMGDVLTPETLILVDEPGTGTNNESMIIFAETVLKMASYSGATLYMSSHEKKIAEAILEGKLPNGEKITGATLWGLEIATDERGNKYSTRRLVKGLVSDSLAEELAYRQGASFDQIFRKFRSRADAGDFDRSRTRLPDAQNSNKAKKKKAKKRGS